MKSTKTDVLGLIHYHDTPHFVFEEEELGNEIEWTEKAETSSIEFLAGGKACKAVLWSALVLKGAITDNSRFSAERILSSASTLPPARVI